MKSSSLMLFAAMFALSLASQAMAQSGSDARPNDPYGYNRFSPSMAIIIAVLIAALFFMGFFSIYIRHCSEGQAAGSVAGGNGAVGRSRRAARGLDAAVIATFPTLEYSAVKGLKIGKGALECAVCLCEFEDDETLRLIPKCDHVFHPECIDTWLESHTTCPVCRANLVPEPGDSVNGTNTQAPPDIENQTNAVEPPAEDRTGCEEEPEPARAAPEPEVLEVSKTLNRNRTRGGGSRSRSSGFRRLFPRSHSTGHSLVQPGENTERFTLRLPEEVRKEILDRQLLRASSMVALPREGSSRRGYRTGEGSSRGGRYGRRLDRMTKSDRWVFSMAPPFFARMSSMKSPKVAATDAGEGPSNQTVGPELPRSDSARPPV